MTPHWRFIFFDSLVDFATPVDACCPACGLRLICGLKKRDDDPTVYYAKCARCGFKMDMEPGDYGEEMDRFVQADIQEPPARR